MEQTKVNQFFTARKTSLLVNPSKRRKIHVEKSSNFNNTCSKRSKAARKTAYNVNTFTDLYAPTVNFSGHSTATAKNKVSTNNDMLAASTEITNVTDDHLAISPKRKLTHVAIRSSSNNLSTTSKPKKMFLIPVVEKEVVHSDALDAESSSIVTSKINNEERGKVTVHSYINEQAKLILYSQEKACSAGRSKDRNLCSAPNFLDAFSTISPPKETTYDRKNKFRVKYANLLKTETPTTSQLSASGDPAARDLTGECSYQKLKHLAQKSIPSYLTLPIKFKNLLETFRSVDSVLYLLNQRSEICTFKKLRKSIQKMTSREFTTDHLAAMKTVFPNGFIFRQESNLHYDGSKSTDYQLTIEANFKDCTNSIKIDSSVLISRRLKFENKLMLITKAFHQKFLSQKNLKLADEEIHRWHPHFKLEEIPDIELSALPRPPVLKNITSAGDILQQSRTHLPFKVQKALENVAMKSTENEEKTNKINDDKNNVNSSSIQIPELNNKLNKVSALIVERIREKERKKMEKCITRDPVQEILLSRINRLPEMTRILKSYFIAERKVAITLEDCVQKLTESYGSSLQSDKIEEHIRLLSELVPSCVTIVMVRQCPYVKLAKSFDLNAVLNSLHNIKSEKEIK